MKLLLSITLTLTVVGCCGEPPQPTPDADAPICVAISDHRVHGQSCASDADCSGAAPVESCRVINCIGAVCAYEPQTAGVACGENGGACDGAGMCCY